MEPMTLPQLLQRAESPAEAWEILVTEGALPEALFDDPNRRFECSQCFGRGKGAHYARPMFRPAGIDYGDPAFQNVCGRCAGRRSYPHPDSVTAAWRFAKVHKDLLRVETLVQEALADLRRQGIPAPPVERFSYNAVAPHLFETEWRGTDSTVLQLTPAWEISEPTADLYERDASADEMHAIWTGQCVSVNVNGRVIWYGEGARWFRPLPALAATLYDPQVRVWEIEPKRVVLLWPV
jgi:hypothetical protein